MGASRSHGSPPPGLLSGLPVNSGSLDQEVSEGLRRLADDSAKDSAEDSAEDSADAAAEELTTGTVNSGPPFTSGSLDHENYEGLRSLRGFVRNLRGIREGYIGRAKLCRTQQSPGHASHSVFLPPPPLWE